MRNILMAISLAMLSFGHAANAQDWDCSNPQAQQEMNYCASLDYDAADRALNVAWNLVYPEIKSRDADMPNETQSWSQTLLQAQRSWLDYRDNHCTAVGFEMRGGSMEPLLVATCRTQLTQERTQDLLLMIETY